MEAVWARVRPWADFLLEITWVIFVVGGRRGVVWFWDGVLFVGWASMRA